MAKEFELVKAAQDAGIDTVEDLFEAVANVGVNYMAMIVQDLHSDDQDLAAAYNLMDETYEKVAEILDKSRLHPAELMLVLLLLQKDVVDFVKAHSEPEASEGPAETKEVKTE